MNNDVTVELKNVSKRFGETVAVDNVSLQIAKGETFAFLGPSGAGKSTLMRLVGGAEFPDEGQIILDGRDVTTLPAYKRQVNTVFQNLLLFPHLTVLENVGYGLRMKGVPRKDISAQVSSILEFMGLTHLSTRKPGSLSGGEQQRVAIARALINRPLVLICDEPLTALDPKLRRQIQSELKRVKEVYRVTLLYITHNHEEALGMADRIGIINKGKIVQVDTPSRIYSAPQSRFVAEFVGEMNVFEAEHAERNSIVTREGDLIRLDNPDLKRAPSPTLWGIRPESVHIQRAADNHHCAVTLSGTLKEKVFTGPTVKYRVRTDSGKVITAELAHGQIDCAVGDAVKVCFSSTSLIPLISEDK